MAWGNELFFDLLTHRYYINGKASIRVAACVAHSAAPKTWCELYEPGGAYRTYTVSMIRKTTLGTSCTSCPMVFYLSWQDKTDERSE